PRVPRAGWGSRLRRPGAAEPPAPPWCSVPHKRCGQEREPGGRCLVAEEPRRRDAARSRQAILDAAERLFAEGGYDAVTLQAVGAAAGVSPGRPRDFFRSTGSLY